MLFFSGEFHLNVNVAQLALFRRSGGVAHEVRAAVVFREGDDFTNGFRITDHHDQTVQAQSQAAVWGCSEAEGVQDVPELFASLFFRDAEGLEHGGLQVAFMDSDRAAAEFRAVEYHVVSLGAEVGGEFSLEQFFFVFLDGTGERMMDGRPALFFLIPAEQRAVLLDLGDAPVAECRLLVDRNAAQEDRFSIETRGREILLNGKPILSSTRSSSDAISTA